ncbi:MAG TPA: tyrosine--tRNA ligase [Elusimicrobiales bacterium]|nr:tyrosine--tRNA ligase [Elusimicrobiales bacterium]
MNILEKLGFSCVDFVSPQELQKKLDSGKKLRVKLGADPTSTDLHLGHAVALAKMRAFQDMGHTGVLVIGDFTASIGDPSGRDTTRPVLTRERIEANAETYKKQAFKILDESKTEVRFNSEWLGGFAGAGGREGGLLSTLSRVTVARLLEREDFQNRMKEGSPISMLEMLYPVFQGYDSVALKSDVELGGKDQLFNLLVGRDLQRDAGQEAQIVMTMPLLPGTDGVRKMSKSYGNYVGIIDEPQQMFGKLMSIPDTLMWEYYAVLGPELLRLGEQAAAETEAAKKLHPMEAKKRLAALVVERLHGRAQAEEARAGFEKVFSKREYPQDMPVFTPVPGQRLSQLLVAAGLAPGMNESRRLIKQGGVRIDGEKIADDFVPDLKDAMVLQVGSRRFCKISLGAAK